MDVTAKNCLYNEEGFSSASVDRISSATGPEKTLVDRFARTISYLRVSVTDRCNLRCLYCKPLGDQAKLPLQDLLSFEELLRIVELAASLGINKVRLTGGEPLLRRDVIPFIKKMSAVPGLEEIRITTNGVLLAEYAGALLEAGISKINISLDTLRPGRFVKITGSDRFDRVMAGIRAVKDLGFASIKLNVVVLGGVNDDEVLDFAELTRNQPLQVRFIEYMPFAEQNKGFHGKTVSVDSIKTMIEGLGRLKPIDKGRLDGPASLFQLEGALGTIGFISPVSHKFCHECNRLRLTAEGMLRSCLLLDDETDLKGIMRRGGSDAAIKEAVLETVSRKPQGHVLQKEGVFNCHGSMSRIGG